MINFKETVTRGHDALEAAENKFDYDRNAWGNASELATCIRKQWYKKHQPDAAGRDERGYARRGHVGEAFMVAGLRAANVPLLYAGSDQITLQSPTHKVSGTPDGILDVDNVWHVVDLKTLDPRVNRNRDFPRKHHVEQIKINMALAELLLDLPQGTTWGTGLLVYMDASNFDDLVQMEIEAEPDVLEEYAKRTSKILRTKSAGALDREGKAGGGKECQTACDFKAVCGVDIEEGVTASGRGNKGSALADDANLFVSLKGQAERITESLNGLKESIKAELRKRKVNEIVVDGIEITLSETAGRKSLDQKAAAKAGIDLSPFQKVGASSERLLVQRKN